MKANSSPRGLGVVLCLAALWAGGPKAEGAVAVTCDEAGLRAAIEQGGTVTFGCDGVITLSQTISISGPVILDGTGRDVSISGGGNVRIFEVMAGGSLTLSGLTLQNGSSWQGGAIYNAGNVRATNCVFRANNAKGGSELGLPKGGAIFNKGFASLDTCTLEMNSATATSAYHPAGMWFTYAYGGGVYLENGKLEARGCAFLKNDAAVSTTLGGRSLAAGGAIYVYSGEMESINCTYATNHVFGAFGPYGRTDAAGGDAKGGAVFIEGGAARFFHNTIAGNESVPGLGGTVASGIGGAGISAPYGVGAGAGIFNEAGMVHMANTILSRNLIIAPPELGVRASFTPATEFIYLGNFAGAVVDLGFNISSDRTLPAIARPDTDPKLGNLGYYGGKTKAFSLSENSPAIDFSNAQYSAETDQRGVSRSSGRAPDAGAFEFEQAPIASGDMVVLRAQVAAGGTIKIAGPVYYNVAEELKIVKDTVIDASDGNVTFDGLGASRILSVSSGAKLTLINASIVNGVAREGAGIFNEGTVVLLGCRFNGNSAVGTPGSVGTNSFARGASGGPGGNGGNGRGGAIFNAGSLIASNCILINNGAKGGSGGRGGAGGPAASYYILDNRCRSSADGGTGGVGGNGGDGLGGAIFSSGPAVVIGCDIGFSETIGGGGGDGGNTGPRGCDRFPPYNPGGDAGRGGNALGGAFYSTGVTEIRQSNLHWSVARGGNGGQGATAGTYSPGKGANGGSAGGGALYVQNAVTLTNVTIAKSLVEGGAGGSMGPNGWCAYPTNWAGNGGSARAGAIQSWAAAVIAFSTIVDNEVRGGSGAAAVGQCSVTGLPGMAVQASIDARSGAELKVNGSIFTTGIGSTAILGAFTDGGFNLITHSTTAFTAATSRTSADTGLVEVSSHGSLPIYRPGLTSVARDFVPGNLAPATDQRGVLRPVGAAADAGAIELAMAEIPAVVLFGAAGVSLEVVGTPAVDYRLFTSTDLVNWSGVKTNRADGAGRVLFEGLDGSAPQRFFMSGEVAR